MSIDFVSWNEIEKLKKKTFFSRRKVFFFEMRDAKWKCLFKWDKMLEKRFWFLFICDYSDRECSFIKEMCFCIREMCLCIQRDVFLFSFYIYK
jgi:hypothetical protein